MNIPIQIAKWVPQGFVKILQKNFQRNEFFPSSQSSSSLTINQTPMPQFFTGQRQLWQLNSQRGSQSRQSSHFICRELYSSNSSSWGIDFAKQSPTQKIPSFIPCSQTKHTEAVHSQTQHLLRGASRTLTPNFWASTISKKEFFTIRTASLSNAISRNQSPNSQSSSSSSSFPNFLFWRTQKESKNTTLLNSLQRQQHRNMASKPPLPSWQTKSTLREELSKQKGPEKNLPFLPHGIIDSLLLPIAWTSGVVFMTFFLGYWRLGVIRDQWQTWKMEHLQKLKSEPGYTRDNFMHDIREYNKRNVTRDQYLLWPVIGTCTAVFLMWKIPFFQPILSRMAMLNPAQRGVSSMTLSMFSHVSPGHLLFNMISFYSFGKGLCIALGIENTLAVFLSGGTIAGLGSFFWKIATRSSIPSLGASGGICTMVGVWTLINPTSQMSLIFLPFWKFEIWHGVLGLISFDLVGLFGQVSKKFNTGFDHVNHLTGTLIGTTVCSAILSHGLGFKVSTPTELVQKIRADRLRSEREE